MWASRLHRSLCGGEPRGPSDAMRDTKEAARPEHPDRAACTIETVLIVAMRYRAPDLAEVATPEPPEAQQASAEQQQ